MKKWRKNPRRGKSEVRKQGLKRSLNGPPRVSPRNLEVWDMREKETNTHLEYNPPSIILHLPYSS
jgi:hypothetical protein